MLWGDFEDVCTSYLRGKYTASLGAVFVKKGASDSGDSDISVTTRKSASFYIEVKKDEAQSGQFVVLPTNDGFTFSPRNKDHLNPQTQTIIDYMNTVQATYTDPGTNGVPLPLPQTLMQNWIMSHYTNKKVRFVISQNKQKEFIVFPLEKLGDYFDITAKYRVKKSGSNHPSVKSLAEIQTLVNDSGANYSRNGKQTIVRSNILIDGQQLHGSKYSYQFNQIEPGVFLIRKLGTTANANVIFSVKLKKTQQPDDLIAFENALVR